MNRLMTLLARPVPGTVLYGMAAGLGWVILGRTLLSSAHWLPFSLLFFRLFVWALLAGYAWLLTGWSGRGRAAMLLPLGALLLVALPSVPPSAYLLLILAGLAWVRGQAAYGHTGLILRRALLEAVLVAGGAFGVYALAPSSLPAVGLAVWGFFCLQAVYFLLLPGTGDPAGSFMAGQVRGKGARKHTDPYESARNSLARLLDEEA